jgi:hypothetical protein
LIVAVNIYFLFQLQSHCNSSRCSVVNFELSFFPSHVEEERLHAFRPLIIQVTFIYKQFLVQQLRVPPRWGRNVSDEYCSAMKACLPLIHYITRRYYFRSPLILIFHICFALLCCKKLLKCFIVTWRCGLCGGQSGIETGCSKYCTFSFFISFHQCSILLL